MRNGRTKESGSRTGLHSAAQDLRRIVLEAEDGALIGSEDALVARLGCSRGTVRQLARLLEREGLLRVKRGPNGGYFGSRPNARTIEASVSAYLETLDMDPEDVTRLASVLWIEVIRKASRADRATVQDLVQRFLPKVAAVETDADFARILELELEWRAAIFELTRSGYIELIFEINSAFARRKFPGAAEEVGAAEHSEFVRAWRESTMLEMTGIRSGDSDLALIGAQYSRKVWHGRMWASHGSA